MERDVLAVVPGWKAKGHCVYGSQLVDLIKNVSKTQACERYSLVLQAPNDSDNMLLPTHHLSSVCQRISLNLSVRWTAAYRFSHEMYLRHMSSMNH